MHIQHDVVIFTRYAYNALTGIIRYPTTAAYSLFNLQSK